VLGTFGSEEEVHAAIDRYFKLFDSRPGEVPERVVDTSSSARD
jgi:hypothetical protein